MTRKHLILTLLLAGLLAPVTQAAPAPSSITWFPQTKGQQYQTYGLFIDNQSTLATLSGGSVWLSVAGGAALAEMHQFASEPQLTFSASVNAGSKRFNNRVTGQTIDSRLMVSWDTQWNEDFLVRIGYSHSSGHVVDDVYDKALEPPNYDGDALIFRNVFLGFHRWKLGVTLRPYIHTDPRGKVFAADEFFEYYPFWNSEAERPVFFVAGGAEQYGADQFDLSLHLQAGLLFGEPFAKKHTQTTRFVIGVYKGPDPGLKTYVFRNHKTHFFYGAIMFDF